MTPGETILTITGSGFGAYDNTGDKVCFNYLDGGYSYIGLCAEYGSSDINSWADTQIIVRVPADPGLIMLGGSLYVYTDSTENIGQYYHVQPVITAIDKSEAFMGETVKLTGRYLKYPLGSAPEATFHFWGYFNGVQTTTSATVWTATEIDIMVPYGATSGPVSLVYSLDDGSAEVSAIGPSLDIYPSATADPYSSLQSYIQQVKIDAAWSLVGQGIRLFQ